MGWRDADDDLDEREYPDEDDADDDDETVPCPRCRRPVYEGAERCPSCGVYLSLEDRESAPRKPWWLVAGVLVCLALVASWYVW